MVNVSSVNAAKPVMGVSCTTSKGALNTMTRNIAMRFAGTGIRCNAIAPGVTETLHRGLTERRYGGRQRDNGHRREVRQSGRPGHEAARSGVRRAVPDERYVFGGHGADPPNR
ncbi:SDR family oxidoreductase [Halocatena pleomorpha]|uniref:SDR family oxidoreductase n=1 Tax=Halocatena pleomorpha TaxID=1785090 RepID=A0A3P3RLA5_9EURY|nr:SDR family oxidoreductase [Halocatena pleomorpha]